MALVLVIDDRPAMRRLVRLTLEPCGHRVLEAGDGLAGVHVLVSERPDALVLDVLLPGAGGLDVLAVLRADRRFAALPVVLLTATRTERVEAAARADGSVRVVDKPFSAAALRRAVADAIAR